MFKYYESIQNRVFKFSSMFEVKSTLKYIQVILHLYSIYDISTVASSIANDQLIFIIVYYFQTLFVLSI